MELGKIGAEHQPDPPAFEELLLLAFGGQRVCGGFGSGVSTVHREGEHAGTQPLLLVGERAGHHRGMSDVQAVKKAERDRPAAAGLAVRDRMVNLHPHYTSSTKSLTSRSSPPAARAIPRKIPSLE